MPPQQANLSQKLVQSRPPLLPLRRGGIVRAYFLNLNFLLSLLVGEAPRGILCFAAIDRRRIVHQQQFVQAASKMDANGSKVVPESASLSFDRIVGVIGWMKFKIF
mmetsp:Transcript_2230/g.4783  ORF Transcript_2230/g.4783 Transcript_2230/m.4783 type:complete len:106 (+) Transcript_2230:818-1135(+)